MLKSIRPLKALIRILMMTFVIMSSSPPSSWGIDARYLPTRSDPLLPIGPPRGEDSRFDRLSDIIIREVFHSLYFCAIFKKSVICKTHHEKKSEKYYYLLKQMFLKLK
jgi:hypothetical protein